MKTDFLLSSDTAKTLYSYAKDLPIIDYHNHLSVQDITENKRFTDIYDLWIKPDPYKHRAMRMCGVSEEYITGKASDFEKFEAWCSVFHKLIGNPLYVWSLMELERVFCICDIPNKENAKEIYQKANRFLSENQVTASSLLKDFNVEFACPCVSLADDVSFFENKKELAPSLRGDDVTSPDLAFVKKLSEDISSLSEYKKAVTQKLEKFKKDGCRFSDHALDNGFMFIPDEKNDKYFEKVLNGEKLEGNEKSAFFSHMLTFLCGEYARLGFTVQLHIGAQRYTSTRLRTLAGAAGGFAAIGNSLEVASFTQFLDTVEKGDSGLPKIILFTLNPADNALISVLSGSYSKDGVKGLITQGPAWWWCDHKYGITEALKGIEAFGLLSNFVGMTTDSRSFLSFVRHDYFRRILCDFLAKKFNENELCCTIDDLKNLINDMCYNNAR